MVLYFVSLARILIGPRGKHGSMRIVKNTIFLLLFLLTQACDDHSRQEMEGDDQLAVGVAEQETIVQDLRNTILLEGGYSSSSQPGQDWFNLFDDDPGSVWQTKLGTGPGERIGLSFLGEGVWISNLIMVSHGQDAAAIIDEVNIFVNEELYAFGPVKDTFRLDTLVKQLSIEFARAGELSYKRFELEGEKVSVGFFPPDKNIGIEYLILQDSSGREYKTVAPKVVKGRLAPSSNLNPLALYHAGHLFDYKKEFGWVEGSEGSGSGDSILFQFDEPQCISKVMIWNGWQASDQKFEENARIKTLNFKPLEDTSQVFFRLKDIAMPNGILVRQNTSPNWILKIIDIFPGKVTRDLVISELLFFDCEEQPFIVNSGLTKQFQNEILSQVEGSPINDILDTYIFNDINSDPDNQYTQKSIILHSDGSFCASSKKYLTQVDVTSEALIDGHWGILEVNEELARLKLLGRWQSKNTLDHELSDRVFEEELIIKKGQIEGHQFLGRYYTE